jgi:hypothetical protein
MNLLPFLAVACAALAAESPAPKKDIRVAIVETLRSEVERVQGDALDARKGRGHTWEKTVEWLKEESAHAETMPDFARVLRRFDAAVPGPRSRATLTAAARPWKATAPALPLEFAPEEIVGEARPKTYRVVSVVASWTEANAPQKGDELLAISGRPMADWSDENFNFCKWPLRSQCERELYANFRDELLSWHRPQALLLRLRRGGKTWDASVASASAERAAFAESAESENTLYPGFAPAYRGVLLKYYTSTAQPATAILRLRSFQYDHDEEADIDSLAKEARHFYDAAWKADSGRIKTLIIDLNDNPGGAGAAPLAKLLLGAPFTDVFVRYKKTADSSYSSFPARRYWTALFSGDFAKKAWLERLRRDGRWESTPTGQFLPKVPLSCASEDDCESARYSPVNQGFTGRVLLLTNRGCLATCASFVSILKAGLKERATLLGEADSGDFSGARIALDVFLDPEEKAGYRVVSAPFDERRASEGSSSFFRMLVSATRAEDSRGESLTGAATKTDVRVPWRYDQNDRQWRAAVVSEALTRAGAK